MWERAIVWSVKYRNVVGKCYKKDGVGRYNKKNGVGKGKEDRAGKVQRGMERRDCSNERIIPEV